MKTTINLKKTLFVLTAATSLSLAFSAQANDESVSKTTKTHIENEADGSYTKETETKAKDASGTAIVDKSNVKVKVDSDGSYKKTTEAETVKDPKGLMNKSVVKASETIKSDDNEYKDESSVETKNGVTGTKTTREGTVKVKTDDKGSVVEKTLETKTVTDPKGLLNKHTEKTVDKIEQNDGKNNYRYTKKVNGKTVEEKSLNSK